MQLKKGKALQSSLSDAMVDPYGTFYIIFQAQFLHCRARFFQFVYADFPRQFELHLALRVTSLKSGGGGGLG